MKVVTSIAAIDSGLYQPTSLVNGKNGIKISGVPLNNDGGEDFGDVDLTFALTHSINTVCAQVGEQRRQGTMQRYMKRLGFEQPAQLDLPLDQRLRQRRYAGARRLRLVAPTERCVDVGRIAIGQDKLAWRRCRWRWSPPRWPTTAG